MENLKNDPVVIVNAKRTAIGGFQGVFSKIPATELGAAVIAGLLADTSLNSGSLHDYISEVIMGCVLPAGLGQAPARQAALKAGLANTIPCTTVNKMCGSGLKTVLQACHSLCADNHKVVIAGGMENMTLAPYLLPKARSGLRLGHADVIDHMFYDGLEDAYTKGQLMGHFAERTAQHYNFSRALQDEFASLSVNRAKKALSDNSFVNEIIPVSYQHRGKSITIDKDEVPDNINLEKIPKLKPAFVLPEQNSASATVTPANSSSIADGASAVVVMRASRARELGLNPLAKILGFTEVAQEPEWFTTAPVNAIKSLLQKTGLSSSNVDLYEINEAFAVVTMAAIHDLQLDQNKVNIVGGACALGHPIGATGARILTTLLHSLQSKKQQVGVAALCIGGGEAIAMAVEMI